MLKGVIYIISSVIILSGCVGTFQIADTPSAKKNHEQVTKAIPKKSSENNTTKKQQPKQ